MSDRTPNKTIVNDTNAIRPATEDPNNYSLDQILRMIRVIRTSSIQNQSKQELTELTKRQSEVRFLTNLRRVVLQATDKKKGFNANYEEFQELLMKAKEKGNENFNELLAEVGIVDGKKNYSTDEANNLIESIRLIVEQLNTLNDMQVQTITRLEGEMNETYQMLIGTFKPLHNAMVAMARAARPN